MQLTFIYHYNYFSFPMLGFQNLFKSHITLVFSNKMLFLTQSYFPLPKVCEIRIERSRESLSICFVGITWCTLWSVSVKTKLREFQTTHQNWTLLSFLSSDCLCPIIIIAQWHKHNYYVYAIVHILFTTTHEEETVRQNDLKIYCPVCCCQKTAAHWFKRLKRMGGWGMWQYLEQYRKKANWSPVQCTVILLRVEWNFCFLRYTQFILNLETCAMLMLVGFADAADPIKVS